MPYSAEHKTATRERILEVAARLFRKQGFIAVSIDKLMAEAGLTRGGFYAHFGSKTKLLSAILRRDFGLQKKIRQARQGELGHGIGPAQAMGYYLSPENLEEIAADCPMACLAADIRRCGAEPAQAFSEKFAELIHELEASGLSKQQSLQTAALSIGAVHLAATLNEADAAAKEQAAALLQACRQQAMEVL